jgi:hypothetical protein
VEPDDLGHRGEYYAERAAVHRRRPHDPSERSEQSV